MTTPETDRKQAALKLIMGDVGEAIEKAEGIAKMLSDVHPKLEEDLYKLGQLVAHTETTISQTMDHATYLTDQLKKAKDSGVESTPATVASMAPTVIQAGKVPYFSIVALSVALSMAFSSVILFMLNYKTFDDARKGQAVQSAVKYLDADTRRKLDQAIQRAAVEK